MDVLVEDGQEADELLRHAGALEDASEHAVARAIAEADPGLAKGAAAEHLQLGGDPVMALVPRSNRPGSGAATRSNIFPAALPNPSDLT